MIDLTASTEAIDVADRRWSGVYDRVAGVFVSYRRSDSAEEAGRIAEALSRRLGSDRVFVDVATLKAGENFLERIDGAVAGSRVCLVVIGSSWLAADDGLGNRRLDDPHDVVRIEVAAALRADRTVIPLLVRGARMPEAGDLPVDLRGLAARHAASIDVTMWSHDVQRLVHRIEEELDESIEARVPEMHLGGSSPLVGREAMLTQIEHAFATSRLVTLTGPGGCGKTRVARELVDRSADARCVFVDLTQIHDAALVPHAMAMATGITASDDEGDLAAVARVLRSEPRALIVLDNCEHLLDEAAAAGAELLSSVPTLRLLVTSRESLALEGELVIAVPPLDLPAAGAMEVGEVASVRLFVERARIADPSFTLDDLTAPHVASICRQVDGIPLALELAAARVRGMAVAEVAARLEERLDLLAKTSRGGDPRHRTMADTLDWSYGLLDRAEARLFDRLSVFDGGWDLEAAEAVCGDGTLDVLVTLPVLAERSLVTISRDDGSVRYRLLEPIRQYAAAHAAEHDEASSLADSHARYITELVDRAEIAIRGPDQDAWEARLRREAPNLRRALAWSEEHQPELMGRIVAASWYSGPFGAFGSVAEVRRWTGRASPLFDAMSVSTRVGVLEAAAWCAYVEGDLESCLDLTEEVSDLDPSIVRPIAATARGSALRDLGRLDEATRLHEAVGRTTPDPWWIARSAYSIGLIELARPNLAAASEKLAEALDRFTDLGDRSSLLDTTDCLAMIALRSGRSEAARSLIDQALASSDQGEVPYELNFAAIDVRTAWGDIDGARRAVRRAFEVAWSSGQLHDLPPIIERLAGLEVLSGSSELAITLLGASDRRRGGHGRLDRVENDAGLYFVDVEATRDAAVAALTAEQAETAWRRGSAIDLDSVPALIDEALRLGSRAQGQVSERSAPAPSTPSSPGTE